MTHGGGNRTESTTKIPQLHLFCHHSSSSHGDRHLKRSPALLLRLFTGSAARQHSGGGREEEIHAVHPAFECWLDTQRELWVAAIFQRSSFIKFGAI